GRGSVRIAARVCPYQTAVCPHRKGRAVKRMTAWRVAAALAVLGVVLGGVGPAAGAATPAAAQPQKGGTLTLAKQTEFAFGWDPVKFQGIPTNGEVPQAFAI